VARYDPAERTPRTTSFSSGATGVVQSRACYSRLVVTGRGEYAKHSIGAIKGWLKVERSRFSLKVSFLQVMIDRLIVKVLQQVTSGQLACSKTQLRGSAVTYDSRPMWKGERGGPGGRASF
jgi:hypothetical protein